MSGEMRDVALKREVELLWHAAESERSKANRLQAELSEVTAALRQALSDLREASEEVAALKVQLRSSVAHMEDSTHHYQELLFDAQSNRRELLAADARLILSAHRLDLVALRALRVVL
ncbi:Hypothetical protein, putative [Bodo saltans]|uniref:Uncharacterized protein n=1 Tax=Bodo saltans TaxID=75058 RepID=A0A0S4ISY7_BODSA|nr:Hypothetical protein, putative [Bodo saltans]|eukprot:CUF35071.1 Hypothetical protein, putative [Bodo saltans]